MRTKWKITAIAVYILNVSLCLTQKSEDIDKETFNVVLSDEYELADFDGAINGCREKKSILAIVANREIYYQIVDEISEQSSK